MNAPLTRVLLKIFSAGFYRVHAGILFFLFLVLFGLVEPSQVIGYHISLMLAFITSPAMMAVVFGIWLLYTLKGWHYVTGQLFAVQQSFLFYSSTSYTKSKQLISWAMVQATINLPVLAYAGVSCGVAVRHHYYLAAIAIVLYLVFIICLSSWFYVRMVNRLIDGSKQSFLIKIIAKWKKPYFSLYIYHVLDKLKLTYLITKALSYLIINGVFLLFADVSHDIRVAGIAVLAIAMAHAIVIFEERKFEETFLIFSRNLPYSRFKLFYSFAAVYLLLLLPEGVWLFTRFSPLMAVGLFAFGISVTLLYHSFLYLFGLNMDKYMQWVPGMFVLIFWLIMFKLIWVIVPLILLIGFLIFYNNYYQVPIVVKGEEK
ncbi:hypothetical protein BEL04_03615 [Mucilaginibacter sp. PPCGB 2223]|uniref:hypothetical protein n=1 Tax=Mucilaginibacter sp. PPCGB 2223 TaxID=1886027 RepID=UPI000824AB81|nr:hypothetical protein [Mucilaginibacter sp. PPCGB 2223]OCX53400.1 hypothetical protein BEL04_03615 [Mucilaginibacter sp. PPCGB 2223]